MKIIKLGKFFFIFSGTLTVISILLWIMWGLNLGIDFTGGSLLEIAYLQNRPDAAAITAQLADLKLTDLKVQASGDQGYILRFQQTGEDIHQQIMTKLNAAIASKPQVKAENVNANSNNNDNTNTSGNVTVTDANGLKVSGVTVQPESANAVTSAASAPATVTAGGIIEKRFDSMGPSIGAELKTKAFYSIILVVLAIISYMAYSFRKVSYPVSSWKYGVAAIIALIHDIFVTIGIFVLLGKFLGFEVNTPFVAALLTILGYSVHDTIVVFDRVRENLHKYEGAFDEIVEKSIWETLARSINTIVTVELALGSLLIFGGGTINDFVLPLMIGIFFGGYSSIFIASQIVVSWQKLDWAMQKNQ